MNKIEVELFFDNEHKPSLMIPKQVSIFANKEECGKFLLPLSSALKKMKEEIFQIIIAKKEEEKKSEDSYELTIKTDEFKMISKHNMKGCIEEGYEDNKAIVNIKGDIIANIFKVMTIPGGGCIRMFFMKTRYKNRLKR